MPAGYVALNGSGSANTGATTLSFNTVRTINAGEQVCCATNSGGGGDTPQSITVGALSLALDKAQGVNTSLSLWSARALSPIASGSTVTLTWAGSPTNRMGICFSLSGIKATSPVDQTASANFLGSDSPTSGTTPSTLGVDEIAVAVLGWRSAVTATPNLGYTEIAEINDSGGANTHIEAAYKTLVGIGAQVATWTMTSGTFGDALIVTYRGAPVLPTRGRHSRGGAW